MNRPNLYTNLKRNILIGLLAVSAFFALFETYFSAFIDLPDNWYISAIFVALILIVEMTTDVKKLDSKFDNVIRGVGWSKVTIYDDYEGFYGDLTESVDEAESSMALTHIRNESPDDFDAEDARNYFQKIERWCNQHPSGRVKRVTTLSNPKMRRWGEELETKTGEVRNFYVRVCDWDFEFPFINLAIIDEAEVYIALTTDTAEETKGIRIKNKKAARAFQQYFDHMWRHSEELGTYLEKETSKPA